MTPADLPSTIGGARTLRWLNAPTNWSQPAPDALDLGAAARTDLFLDPASDERNRTAPALLLETAGCTQITALVSVDHTATFDAGALIVWHSDNQWAKLALERSPQGELVVVSVVSNGASDDANGPIVTNDAVWLRVTRLARSVAFHYAEDGANWRFVRHFALTSGQPPTFGLLAQSPTGEGCQVRFRNVRCTAQTLSDLRSGE